MNLFIKYTFCYQENQILMEIAWLGFKSRKIS